MRLGDTRRDGKKGRERKKNSKICELSKVTTEGIQKSMRNCTLRSHVTLTRALALSHSLSRYFPSTLREKNFLGESHSPHSHKAKTRKVESWQDEETRQGHWRYPLEFSRACRSSQWIWLLRHQAQQAVVWCDNDAIGGMGLRWGIRPEITARLKLQAERPGLGLRSLLFVLSTQSGSLHLHRNLLI